MRSLRAGTWILVIASGVVLLAIGLYLAAGRAAPDTRVYRIGWEHDPPFQVALADGQTRGTGDRSGEGSGAATQYPPEMDPAAESGGSLAAEQAGGFVAPDDHHRGAKTPHPHQ